MKIGWIIPDIQNLALAIAPQKVVELLTGVGYVLKNRLEAVAFGNLKATRDCAVYPLISS